MQRMMSALLLAVTAASAAAEPYAAAEVGYGRVDFSLGTPFRGDIDDEAMTTGVNLGYRFSELLEGEIGASWYGDVSGRGSPCPAGDICILSIRTIPDNDIRVYRASLLPGFERGDVRLFGRVGYYRADIDTNIAFEGGDFTEEGWTLGAGLRWSFADDWSIAGEASVLGDEMRQIGLSLAWHP